MPCIVETFVAAPEPESLVKAQSYYTQTAGVRLMSFHGVHSKPDKSDIQVVRVSEDNGRTWCKGEACVPIRPHANGTYRMGLERVYPDPATGRTLILWVAGVLPTDNPLEGLRQMMPFYAVSCDGGRTRSHNGPLVCEGKAST